MTKLNSKCFDKIQVNLTKQITALKEQAEQDSMRDLAQDKDLKQSVNQLVKSISEKQVSMEEKV